MSAAPAFAVSIAFNGGTLPSGSPVWFEFNVHTNTTLSNNSLTAPSGWGNVSVVAVAGFTDPKRYRFTLSTLSATATNPFTVTFNTGTGVVVHIKPFGQDESTHTLDWI